MGDLAVNPWPGADLLPWAVLKGIDELAIKETGDADFDEDLPIFVPLNVHLYDTEVDDAVLQQCAGCRVKSVASSELNRSLPEDLPALHLWNGQKTPLTALECVRAFYMDALRYAPRLPSFGAGTLPCKQYDLTSWSSSLEFCLQRPELLPYFRLRSRRQVSFLALHFTRQMLMGDRQSTVEHTHLQHFLSAAGAECRQTSIPMSRKSSMSSKNAVDHACLTDAERRALELKKTYITSSRSQGEVFEAIASAYRHRLLMLRWTPRLAAPFQAEGGGSAEPSLEELRATHIVPQIWPEQFDIQSVCPDLRLRSVREISLDLATFSRYLTS